MGPEAKLTRRQNVIGTTELLEPIEKMYIRGRREIGLKSKGEEGDDFLGMGTMLEVFHSSGKVPDIIEELKINFSLVAEIPSRLEEVREDELKHWQEKSLRKLALEVRVETGIP